MDFNVISVITTLFVDNSLCVGLID